MRMNRERSALWVIDMQDKLLNHVDDWQRVLDAVMWLTAVARELGVPVLVSEQYPKGLGRTQQDLLAVAGDAPVVDKVDFSCVEAGCFDGVRGADAEHVVVCGIEAHVCVMQTVLDLAAAGRKVFVVADAIGSRAAHDRLFAIERMRAAGATVVTREMVCFEWLVRSGSDEFKRISKEYLR